jgi:hypothetical protein
VAAGRTGEQSRMRFTVRMVSCSFSRDDASAASAVGVWVDEGLALRRPILRGCLPPSAR